MKTVVISALYSFISWAWNSDSILFIRCIYIERFSYWMRYCTQCPSMDHDQSNNSIGLNYEESEKSVMGSGAQVWHRVTSRIVQATSVWEREWISRTNGPNSSDGNDQMITVEAQNSAIEERERERGRELVEVIYIFNDSWYNNLCSNRGSQTSQCPCNRWSIDRILI